MRKVIAALIAATFIVLIISAWTSDAGAQCEVGMLQGTSEGCK